jgi:hypothetical protein
MRRTQLPLHRQRAIVMDGRHQERAFSLKASDLGSKSLTSEQLQIPNVASTAAAHTCNGIAMQLDFTGASQHTRVVEKRQQLPKT